MYGTPNAIKLLYKYHTHRLNKIDHVKNKSNKIQKLKDRPAKTVSRKLSFECSNVSSWID